MARLIKVLQLPKRGRYGPILRNLAPPMDKSLRRIPQFSTGDLNQKVISNALYGLPPFSLLALYRCPACQRAGFLHEK
jgi:hypothetical protein